MCVEEDGVWEGAIVAGVAPVLDSEVTAGEGVFETGVLGAGVTRPTAFSPDQIGHEVAQDAEAVLGEDRLGMELDAPEVRAGE